MIKIKHIIRNIIENTCVNEKIKITNDTEVFLQKWLLDNYTVVDTVKTDRGCWLLPDGVLVDAGQQEHEDISIKALQALYPEKTIEQIKQNVLNNMLSLANVIRVVMWYSVGICFKRISWEQLDVIKRLGKFRKLSWSYNNGVEEGGDLDSLIYFVEKRNLLESKSEKSQDKDEDDHTKLK